MGGPGRGSAGAGIGLPADDIKVGGKSTGVLDLGKAAAKPLTPEIRTRLSFKSNPMRATWPMATSPGLSCAVRAFYDSNSQ